MGDSGEGKARRARTVSRRRRLGHAATAATAPDLRGKSTPPKARIVACLSGDLLLRMRAALRPGEEAIEVSPDALGAHIPSGDALLLIDPMLLSAADTARVAEWWAPKSVVVYTVCAPEPMRRALSLSRLGITQVAFRDEPHALLREAIDGAALAVLSRRVEAELLDRLLDAPSPVSDFAILALSRPSEFRTVLELSVRAKTSRDSIERWFKECGIAPPKKVAVAGRVMWAYQRARGGVSLIAIARRLGYARPRDLTAHIRQCLECDGREIGGIEANAFVARILAKLIKAQ